MVAENKAEDLADRVEAHLNEQMGPFAIKVPEWLARDALDREGGNLDRAWETIMGTWDDYAGSVNVW